MILTEQRGEEIAGAIKSILLLLGSITEEELQAIKMEAERDSALGPFFNPSAYLGERFHLNQKMNMIAERLLELKRGLYEHNTRR